MLDSSRQGGASLEIEITPEMIEAGIEALQRRGFGNDGDSINSLQSAVSAIFLAMVESSHLFRQSPGTE
jgi:hypothetical protein